MNGSFLCVLTASGKHRIATFISYQLMNFDALTSVSLSFLISQNKDN